MVRPPNPTKFGGSMILELIIDKMLKYILIAVVSILAVLIPLMIVRQILGVIEGW